MINIDKSIFILSGFLPMTDQEEAVFNFENPTKVITILGRDYHIREIKRSSDGTFKVSLIPLVKIQFPIKE